MSIPGWHESELEKSRWIQVLAVAFFFSFGVTTVVRQFTDDRDM